MNPYFLERPPLDLRAMAVYIVENERCNREYNSGSLILDAACQTCTEAVTCWRCRRKARRLLTVATSEVECGELLAIIDRPGPATPKCGTPGGYKAHRRRDEDACADCLAAHNEVGRRNRARRSAS